MIKREYKTKLECVECMMHEEFDFFPSGVVTDQLDFFGRWEFYGKLDEDEAENYGCEYGYVDVPMWSTWFIPSDSFHERFIMENPETVMDCGFTIIVHDGEFFGLGVDGAGYSFRDTHFMRLYDAQDLKWHDEEQQVAGHPSEGVPFSFAAWRSFAKLNERRKRLGERALRE